MSPEFSPVAFTCSVVTYERTPATAPVTAQGPTKAAFPLERQVPAPTCAPSAAYPPITILFSTPLSWSYLLIWLD